MTTCRYCGNDDGPEHDTVHPACVAEYEKRKAAKLCVFCGEKLTDSEVAGSWTEHMKCPQSHSFSGYPGQ